jgi:hypothetical protein
MTISATAFFLIVVLLMLCGEGGCGCFLIVLAMLGVIILV